MCAQRREIERARREQRFLLMLLKQIVEIRETSWDWSTLAMTSLLIPHVQGKNHHTSIHVARGLGTFINYLYYST